MKKSRLLRTGTAAVLSICMLAGAVPAPGLTLMAKAYGNTTEFTDENSRGGWQKTKGDGTIRFVDGEGADGYMEVWSDNETIFADTEAEDRLDGYVEMDLEMSYAPNGGRMGIIFRYNSPTDWAGIGIDSGSWVWFTGSGDWGNVVSTEKTFVQTGERHRVRIEYRGQNVRVILDGTNEIINQDISGFGNTASGKIGLRLWGLKSENYDNAFHVDNVTSGELGEEAGISPESIELKYEEAGTEDYTISLRGEKPALTSVLNGNTELTEGTDYTVDGTQVTIRKEYIDSIKETGAATLTFLFEDGQRKNCSIIIEKEDEDVTYSRDFSQGTDGMEMVSGSGTMEDGEAMTIQGDGLFIDQSSYALKNQEVEFAFDPLNNSCNYGVVLRYTSPDEYIYVGPASQNNQHYTYWGIYGPNGQLVNIQDSGFILQGRTEPYKVKVRIIDDVITIFVDNEEIYNGEVSGITMKAGRTGFRTTQNTGMRISGFVQETAKAPETAVESESVTIASDEMTVELDKDFPRVIGYELSSGERMSGQEVPIRQVEINNKLYTPTVSQETEGNTAKYHVAEAETGISFDVVFRVEKNVLSMNIVNVSDETEKLYTLNFPGHSLVSISGVEAGAQLTVNNFQGETKYDLSAVTSSDAYQETTLAPS